jgi:hypothetical protein
MCRRYLLSTAERRGGWVCADLWEMWVVIGSPAKFFLRGDRLIDFYFPQPDRIPAYSTLLPSLYSYLSDLGVFFGIITKQNSKSLKPRAIKERKVWIGDRIYLPLSLSPLVYWPGQDHFPDSPAAASKSQTPKYLWRLNIWNASTSHSHYASLIIQETKKRSKKK